METAHIKSRLLGQLISLSEGYKVEYMGIVKVLSRSVHTIQSCKIYTLWLAMALDFIVKSFIYFNLFGF